RTPELRPGYLALNDSSIFLDNEGGSLANSFFVVEGKNSPPDLVANCLKSSKNDYRINCLTCDVIFCGSSAIASRAEYASGNTVRHCCHISFSLSPRRPGSTGKTSITLDYVHAGGRVHSRSSSHWDRYSSRKSCWFCASFSCMSRVFSPLLS
nr:hypothetical protein [Tanacetum cinerariifolium]